jgi:hypothetical protein
MILTRKRVKKFKKKVSQFLYNAQVAEHSAIAREKMYTKKLNKLDIMQESLQKRTDYLNDLILEMEHKNKQNNPFKENYQRAIIEENRINYEVDRIKKKRNNISRIK